MKVKLTEPNSTIYLLYRCYFASYKQNNIQGTDVQAVLLCFLQCYYCNTSKYIQYC